MPEWVYVASAIGGYLLIGVIVACIWNYFEPSEEMGGPFVFFWGLIIPMIIVIGICYVPYILLEWANNKGKARKERIKKIREENKNGVSDQPKGC